MARLGRYVPGFIAQTFDSGNVTREFTEVRKAIDGLYEGQMEILHAQPERLEAGLFVYADGTDWNPGSGEGLYVYKSTGWVLVG